MENNLVEEVLEGTEVVGDSDLMKGIAVGVLGAAGLYGAVKVIKKLIANKKEGKPLDLFNKKELKKVYEETE